MTVTYAWDIFASLDGYGSHNGDWGGYWGKQGPELLDHRLALYDAQQRMVFGANTFREFVRLLGSSTEGTDVDAWNTRMRNMPATVVSSTLEETLDWPNTTVVSGDAVDVVSRLEGAEVRALARQLVAELGVDRCGLVDLVQVTIFPVITGQTGLEPIFQGATDFDLELLETRTLDGHTQGIYRPTLHRGRSGVDDAGTTYRAAEPSGTAARLGRRPTRYQASIAPLPLTAIVPLGSHWNSSASSS